MLLEVPGLTEDALRAMSPTAVQTMRWALYARTLAPSATIDIDAQLEDLADADRAPSAATVAWRRGRLRESLMQSKIAQAAIRELLLLDDESEDAEGVA